MHTHSHTNWKVKIGSSSEMVWKAKAVCPNEGKENNHRQMHQHPNLQPLTNTHTHTDWVKCVCVHVWANVAAALVVQIYYNYRLTMDVQHHTHAAKHWVNNTLKNDCLYPQHSTPINYELSTSHLRAHTNTHKRKQTDTLRGMQTHLEHLPQQRDTCYQTQRQYRQTHHTQDIKHSRIHTLFG